MSTEAQAVDLPRAALPRYPTPMWSIVWVIFWIARSPPAQSRGRLRSGPARGAKEPHEPLRALRPGTIEGGVLLARVLGRAGEGGDARRTLAEACRAWRHARRFVRRRDRTWMWRARPLVGAAQLGLALAVALLAAAIVPRVAIRGIGGIESAEATEMPEPEQEADRREAPQGPESEPEAPAARATRSR